MNKHKEGKGHWKKELGSNSESAVRAFGDPFGVIGAWKTAKFQHRLDDRTLMSGVMTDQGG